MSELVAALVGFVVGGLLGTLVGARYTGTMMGRSLRRELEHGRLSVSEAERIADLPRLREDHESAALRRARR